jgi:hypothetical protein
MGFQFSKLTKPQVYKLSVIILALLYTYFLASFLPKNVNDLLQKGLLGIIIMASLIFISTHSIKKALFVSITFFTFMSIADSEIFFPKHKNTKDTKIKIENFQDGNNNSSNPISDFNVILDGNYNKIGTYQTFSNTPACKNIKYNTLEDAIDACNNCNACDGISKIEDDYILGQRPVNEITMFLKKPQEGQGLQLPPIILPGATTDITKKIYPNCKFRCNPDEISFEFNDKRKQFFGLDANTPNIDTEQLKTEYTDGIFPPPTSGGSKWKADESYTRLPVNLNKCKITYPIDDKNEWNMDAYLDPNSNCELRVLAQNPDNIYNNQKIDLTQAYGGIDSMFGPVAYTSTS